jgi:hypothetical protein
MPYFLKVFCYILGFYLMLVLHVYGFAEEEEILLLKNISWRRSYS